MHRKSSRRLSELNKGMEKFQRGIEDIWVIKLGVITTILRDELKYDLFGNRVEGKYWIVYIDTKYGEDIRVYIEKQTLKIDDFYTQEKFQESLTIKSQG